MKSKTRVGVLLVEDDGDAMLVSMASMLHSQKEMIAAGCDCRLDKYEVADFLKNSIKTLVR